MSEDEANQRDLQRAQQVQSLLSSPVLKEAFAALKQSFIKDWEYNTKPVERERLWEAVQIVGRVESMLLAMIADGRLATAQLEELAKLGEKTRTPRESLDFAHH